MNERIVELMNEANKTSGFTFSMDQAKSVHDLMEKFAELIVQECMSITGQCSTGPGLHDLFADNIIREHFGVAE
jgi:hypothetical protein